MPDISIYAKPLVALQLLLRLDEVSSVLAKHTHEPLEKQYEHIKTRVIFAFGRKDVADIHIKVERTGNLSEFVRIRMQEATNKAVTDAFREIIGRTRIFFLRKADVVTTIGTGTWDKVRLE